jgi:hypothetical protein
MTTANSAGFSLEWVVLSAAQAKATRHQDSACHSRTLSVAHAAHHGGLIETVTCSACATPQRCTAPSAGGSHGRPANVLTPAGWRCFECAAAGGYWNERRDGFARLLVGW